MRVQRGTLKKVLLVVGGVCAAAAGFLALGAKRVSPVGEYDDPASQPEDAWADEYFGV
jgi:hypothetical protein